MSKIDEAKSKPIALTYSRISGTDDARTLSLENQEEQQVAKLEARGYVVPPEYRLREHFTGMESIYERPVLIRVRELVASGKVQAVGCYDTDRLARDPKDLITVVASNRANKVETIFVRQDHETAGRVGEMLLYMQGFASATEYDRIADRTMSARMKLINSGKWFGGGPPRFGYIWDKETRTRTAHEETAPIVRRIFAMVAGGTSATSVAVTLNDEQVPAPSVWNKRRFKDNRTCHWTAPTIVHIIRDRTYIGEPIARRYMPVGPRLPSGRRKVVRRPPDQQVCLADGRTEALVDAATFEAANSTLRLRVSRVAPSQRAEATHLLAGMIWCAECGSRLSPENSKQSGRRRAGRVHRTRNYRCLGDHQNMKVRNGCNVNLGAKWVEETTWAMILKVIEDEDFLDRECDRVESSGVEKQIRRDLEAAEKKKLKLEKSIKSLIDAMGWEDSSSTIRDALKSKLAEVDSELEVTNQRIAMTKQNLVPFRNMAKTKEDLQKKVAKYREKANGDGLTVTERRELMMYLGIRVIAGRGRVCRVEADIRVACGDTQNTSCGISGIPTVGVITILLA